jgi:glycosyltransferase involved in cell wall biosynthesis
MRFAFLQSGLTGYNDACLRALHAQGNEILNVYPPKANNYAFDADSFSDYAQNVTWEGQPDQAVLDRAIDEFRPDVVVMVSWSQPAYRAVMKRMRGKALRILVSTNIWENRPRQWLGRATHRWYLDPLYDCVFVPGDRSEWFARRLGFKGEQIIRGSNSADVDVFDRGPRDPAEFTAARRFLFTGRLMPYKGVTVLRDAYRAYREAEAEPWDIDIVGIGELGEELAGIPGVHMHGFVSPTELSDLMHRTTCLVLPSYIDFFGVVVHEAALAGQVLVCSDGVGATPYLLQDGFNGWTVAAGSVRSLAGALTRVTHLPDDRLLAMSTGSRNLASRFSPRQWAVHLTEEVSRRITAGEHRA